MRRRALLLAALLVATTADAAELRTTSGERWDDEIAAIDAVPGGPVIVVTAKGRRIPLGSLKSVTFDRPGRGRAEAGVYLVNGDELRGVVGDGNGDSFKLATEKLGTLDVSLDAVAGIFFRLSGEEETKLATRLLGWIHGRGKRADHDIVTLARGGTARGRLTRLSGTEIVVAPEKGTLPPCPTREVKWVVTTDALGPQPPQAGTLVRLRCADGTLVTGAPSKLAAGKLALAHILGPITVPLDDVVELTVLHGDITYLSDVGEPTKVLETFPDDLPRDAFFSWKRDREVEDGGPLRVGGRTFEKGLGVHSRSELTFAIAGKYKRFQATVGLDDATRHLGEAGMGSVTFRVLLDGKPARELPEGLLKKRGEPGSDLSVNLDGVKELTLVADYGTWLHVLGRADWADAFVR
jgi:hypothetical protein